MKPFFIFLCIVEFVIISLFDVIIVYVILQNSEKAEQFIRHYEKFSFMAYLLIICIFFIYFFYFKREKNNLKLLGYFYFILTAIFFIAFGFSRIFFIDNFSFYEYVLPLMFGLSLLFFTFQGYVSAGFSKNDKN